MARHYKSYWLTKVKTIITVGPIHVNVSSNGIKVKASACACDKRKKKRNDYFTQRNRRGLGELHAGSLRAENKLNEQSNAIFEQFATADFVGPLGSKQQS